LFDQSGCSRGRRPRPNSCEVRAATKAPVTSLRRHLQIALPRLHLTLPNRPLFANKVAFDKMQKELANRHMDEVTMWRAILRYLERIPGSMKEVQLPDGKVKNQCVYTPHSFAGHDGGERFARCADLKVGKLKLI
jgi:hypothetical protein